MKNILVFSIAFFILFTFISCDKNESLGYKEYYNLEDFKSIIVGESTFTDVSKIAPTDDMEVTSYGFLIKYPMKDGRKICIKLNFTDEYFDKHSKEEIIVRDISILP